jgi:signal peptidase
MKKARRVVAAVAGAFAWLLVAASAVFLLGLGIVPHTGWYRTVTVLSASMRPRMPEGSVAIITPERPEQVRVGQVITYQVPVGDHRIITHRVVAVTEGLGSAHPVIQTKGDANNAPDPWLARIDGGTTWRARFSLPWIGRLISWLRGPTLHTGLVRVVPALLTVFWLVTIWRDDEDPAAVGPEPSAA